MDFCSRKSTRMPGYDYRTSGYYFITICTKDKKCLFGTTKKLNEWGKIAERDLVEIPQHFSAVQMDACIVMPNHVHMILKVEQENTASVNHMIGLYKSGVSRKIRKNKPDAVIWQRSYYDHVIRNQAEYEKIWEYVMYNRQKWEADCYYLQDANQSDFREGQDPPLQRGV